MALGLVPQNFMFFAQTGGKADPYWLYILTVFPQFRIDAANNMTGSAGQRRVPASFLEEYCVTVPPIELQEQFAAFAQATDKSKYGTPSKLGRTGNTKEVRDTGLFWLDIATQVTF